MLFTYLQATCVVCSSPKAPAAGHAPTHPRSRGVPAVPGPKSPQIHLYNESCCCEWFVQTQKPFL